MGAGKPIRMAGRRQVMPKFEQNQPYQNRSSNQAFAYNGPDPVYDTNKAKADPFYRDAYMREIDRAAQARQ